MAQWVKIKATKADNLSSVPLPHMVEEETPESHTLASTRTPWYVSTHTHAHAQTHIFLNVSNVIKIMFSY